MSAPAPARGMFRVEWGRTPNCLISFHHCILIADDCVTKKVTAETRGRVFDWGSFNNGKWIKEGSEVKVKSFGPEQYKTGCTYGNKYEYFGTTQRSDDEIKKAINDNGSYYNLALNNCHDVVRKTILALSYPIGDYPSIESAISYLCAKIHHEASCWVKADYLGETLDPELMLYINKLRMLQQRNA